MSRRRVFIVDDDPDFADSLALVLESRNCLVEQARTGEDAVDRCRESDFDITFMDVRLPGMNGLESYLEIKRLKPHARVVMMTGYSIQTLLDEATRQGAWEVLEKPLDIHRVLGILEDLPPHAVLIVDDDPDFAECIQQLLLDSGREVFVAFDGAEALRSLEKASIDVLILDIRLPSPDGLEILTLLRARGHSVPVIVVSAYVSEECAKIEDLRKLFVSDVLEKPFDPQTLLDAISVGLESRTKCD